MFVHRTFGKYMKRSADEQQVSVLLKDFEDADQLLTKIIESARAWREAWISILTYQHRLFSEFELLYAPIIGATDDYQGHAPVETPERISARTTKLKSEYEDLKRDLMEELDQVEARMIRPAQDTKDNLQIARKVIKKREDKKLDFERYQGRVDTGMKRTKPSDRDRAALVKAQTDLTVATESYQAADDHLRRYLPPLLMAVFSLQPHLLAAQIQIQNSLLAHYYTMLHNYCQDEGFPSPAPPMDEVIRIWDDNFKATQKEAEAIAIIATGKTVRTSLSKETNGTHGTGGVSTGTNGFRRPSRGPSVSPARPQIAAASSPSHETKPAGVNSKIATSPSATSLLSPVPTPSDTAITSPSPSVSAYQSPLSFSPAAPHTDYFSRDRQQSSSNNHNHHGSSQPTTPGGVNAAIASALAGKKKPPPPPPPRIPSYQFTYVTALYDFGGQGDGDLAFREGDRIKVLKKTESTDDWWQGELRGVKGMFPANYVE